MIRSVKFEASYDEAPLRLPLPQIAFCGRSNVGKSSLINAILSQNIAFVSKKPGKTALINLFLVNDSFYLVDLPGYGYAKRSKRMLMKWQRTIEDYLKNANLLKHLFVLIDSRHPPQKSDLDFIEWLQFHSKPFSVVLTKIDKATQKQIHLTSQMLRSEFGIERIFTVSSVKKRGIEELRRAVLELSEYIPA